MRRAVVPGIGGGAPGAVARREACCVRGVVWGRHRHVLACALHVLEEAARAHVLEARLRVVAHALRQLRAPPRGCSHLGGDGHRGAARGVRAVHSLLVEDFEVEGRHELCAALAAPRSRGGARPAPMAVPLGGALVRVREEHRGHVGRAAVAGAGLGEDAREVELDVSHGLLVARALESRAHDLHCDRAGFGHPAVRLLAAAEAEEATAGLGLVHGSHQRDWLVGGRGATSHGEQRGRPVVAPALRRHLHLPAVLEVRGHADHVQGEHALHL
mmetsp:Transcript_7496/g.30461  ORF Transcript_7496/g.30461 Transcript_7496/m.30461 type:complete len:272 (-) Transcript_7496:767-1582(-)